MSGEDIRELWEAIEGLRRGQGDILVGLSEVKAALNERCRERARRMDAQGQAIEGAGLRIAALERGQARLFAWASLAGGAAALAGHWLLKTLGGS
ncbi:hypothetical protein dsat_1766 [Alkalidesulfovibrio alkalitolerans DSM 16529]|uniref:Uncharacterized protein n=1 Tax=Alkalidesulfovibrio alkalitolerans DSM 16529 TaxID=1121439 RepID=S7UV66_9BACT|nr:hypothetical protein [Alkalidesulfovibrio alkalitolerans]EPR36238.1 hypothetical protein dsat_1766 [Alkalidesulfovibrio alkalitolerans DSM 16529]